MIRRTPILRWSAKKWARKARKEKQAISETEIRAVVLDHWRAHGRPDTLVAAADGIVIDLIVLAPSLPIGFIGLKRNLGSPMTAAQREFGELCLKLGVAYAVVAGRRGPIRVLEAWRVVNAQPEGGPNGAPAGRALNRRKQRSSA
jgi:hypothetical protein